MVTRLLAGIRVLDFGRFIAGPYAAMLMADFGADVIRVERREGGEDRWVGPVTPSGEGGLFLNLNRNKRGVTLDPAHARARDLIARLVRTADIVVVNLPIEVMRKLGLDYESLHAIKSDIILVMASAFGPEGPYRDRVGFDGIAQAMSGAMSLTGFPDSPVRSVVSWADYGTALHAAYGAIAALYHRAQTGKGQCVDVSLLSTSVMFMTPFLMERTVMDIRRQRQGNTAYYMAPSDCYRTRDGWILVPTIGQPMFRRWTRLVGRDDLLNDPRMKDDITRGNHSALVNEVMAAWSAARTRDEAIAQLEAARIPCGPVYELDEVVDDAQVKARGLLVDSSYPTSDKPIPLAPPAVRLSETPGEVRARAPRIGEHTDEVLRELGYSQAEIDSLRAAEVI
jgi:crotonobetainyl-CoA:carnitine CoA-transferase CaiB-like acyl-CoA transferase